jgi:hypothetical protein
VIFIKYATDSLLFEMPFVLFGEEGESGCTQENTGHSGGSENVHDAV